MGSQANLLLTDNYGQVHEVIPPYAQIGSDPQCTIVFDESGVSSVHANLQFQDSMWILQDATENNDISINGEQIQADYQLKDEDVISIGSIILRVSLQETEYDTNQFQYLGDTPQSELRDLSGFRSNVEDYQPNTQIITDHQVSKKRCRACGQLIHPEAEICPHCGVRQTALPKTSSTGGKKSKSTAGLVAILLGGIGGHKFYLGQPVLGIIYLLLVWTGLPSILGVIEGIYYLTMSDEIFAQKYG